VASRVVRSMGLSAASSAETMRTPGGGFRLEKENEVGPSMPLYPRSSLVVPDENAAGAAIKQAQNGIETSTYHTTDVRDYVDTWYAGHLSPEFTRHSAGDKPVPEVFSNAGLDDDVISFVAERDQMIRVVALTSDSGGTMISLIRLNKSTQGADASPAVAAPQPAPAQPDATQ
jgi:hypothetical protein